MEADAPTQAAPRWSAAFSLDHQADIGDDFLLKTSASVNYRDSVYHQRFSRFEGGSLTLVDLRLALASSDESWEIALLGKNLLDDQELMFGFPYPVIGTPDGGAVALGSLNRPRTIALQARYNF